MASSPKHQQCAYFPYAYGNRVCLIYFAYIQVMQAFAILRGRLSGQGLPAFHNLSAREDIRRCYLLCLFFIQKTLVS
jgi:hypothetical protein